MYFQQTRKFNNSCIQLDNFPHFVKRSIRPGQMPVLYLSLQYQLKVWNFQIRRNFLESIQNRSNQVKNMQFYWVFLFRTYSLLTLRRFVDPRSYTFSTSVLPKLLRHHTFALYDPASTWFKGGHHLPLKYARHGIEI